MDHKDGEPANPSAAARRRPQHSSFGVALRELRLERGLSLADLARITHYSKGYLSKIENGRKPVNGDVARLCDDALAADGVLLALLPPALREEQSGPGDGESCPYPGLSAFGPRDAGRFFGRERAVAALVQRLAQRFGKGPVAVVALSGSGKSSLLGAGLVPALADGGPGVGRDGSLSAGVDIGTDVDIDRGPPADTDAGAPVVMCTPTARPLSALLHVLRAALPAGLLDHLHDDGPPGERADRLVAALRSWALAARRPRGCVVIVDQFEEVFTLCDDETERGAYVAALAALAGGGDEPEAGATAFTVVLGVRADVTGRCLEYPQLVPVVSDGLFALGAMTTDELRECIVRPAAATGTTLEPGLVELLLRDLGAADTAGAAGNGPDPGVPIGRPGVLPLLGHALRETWHRRTDSTMTVAGYLATGGIHGSVAAAAEDLFAALSPVRQDAARRLLLRLVRVGEDNEASRRPRTTSELLDGLRDPAAARATLDALVAARLLTVDADRVEIVHEALLRAWPRLRTWVGATRADLLLHQQLGAAAREWDRENRDPSLLYRGARLTAAREWAAGPSGRDSVPTPVEADFLRASDREEDLRRRLSRRRVRQQRAGVVVLTVLLALALLAGATVFEQRTSADEQRRTALSQAMAASSAQLAFGRPEASMLLAESAYRTSRTTEARGALLSTQANAFAGRLTGHHGAVNCVVFGPGRRLLASASSDGTVRLWDAAAKRSVGELAGHHGPVRSVSFSPDGRTLASASSDATIRLWSVSDRRQIAVLTGHRGPVRAVSFSPDGRTVASAGQDGTVRLWDTRTHRQTGWLPGHSGDVLALAYAPDGSRLASAGADRTVRLWNPHTRRNAGVLSGHSGDVLAVAFSPDSRVLATGGADRTVRLWDPATHRQTALLAGHDDDVNGLAFGPGGHTVVSAGGDGTIVRWDVHTRRTVDSFSGHTDYVMAVAVAERGDLLATAGFDGTVALWDLTGHTLSAYPVSELWKAAFSPDGRMLASAATDGALQLWDVGRRTLVRTLTGHSGAAYAVAFSPDGRWLASAGADHTVRLWPLAAGGGAPVVLSGHTRAVFDVTFSPDGRWLASASADNTVRLWRMSSAGGPAGTRATVLTGHTDFVNCLAFSADSATVVSGSDDLTLRLWNVSRGSPTAVLTAKGGSVRAVAFAPGGRSLASSGNDGVIRMWDVAGARVTGLLGQHAGSVRGLAFSPDGRSLASSGNDRTVRLWDTVRRRLVATLTGHTRAVWSVAYAPDGRRVASAGNDGTVRLWDLGITERVAALCRVVGPVDRGRWQRLLPGYAYSGTCAD
ncbi:DNA-binding protein [Streptomyces sp. P3]|uniref:nSTAND1 domain-containing NTPase n=1 Tax=Streptomyces sp. P3 TaxID=2135430 RepID=UPI000D1AE2EC|nr:helix-turn-helix domain-containing protein [Streptomyces sp. P3]AVV47096.1 DNA-binding protein [Streptomyces sp. P3]